MSAQADTDEPVGSVGTAAFAAFPILPFHRAMIHVIIIADLCFSSRLYQAVLPDIAQRLLLSTLLLVSIGYLVISVLRGHVVPALLAVLAGGLILGQINVFAANWGMGINWPGIAQYSVFMCFIAIFVISRDGLAPYFIRTLVTYALIYVAFYIGFVAAYHAGVLPAQISRPLLLNDAERGDRFFAYGAALAFTWYFAIDRIRERVTVGTLLMFLACALANILTLSRVYLLCLMVVTALSVLRMPRWLIRAVGLGALFFVSGVLLYGMLDVRWNPFFTFASNDTSGLGRAFEYQVAQELLSRTPVWGLGLPSSPEQPALLTGVSFFSAGDLGTAGVLLDLGLLGLLLFFASSCVACSQIHIVPNSHANALFLTGCTLAFYGTIAPLLFSPGGTFYFAVILGMWLAQETRQTYRAAPRNEAAVAVSTAIS